jgi:hypothetical protein
MSALPLYERYDRETQRHTKVVTDGETGLPLIIRSQNYKPILESAKAIAASFDPHVKRDVVHVARIDRNTWANLVRIGIAGDEKAMNAWLNSREGRAFRTDDGRRL